MAENAVCAICTFAPEFNPDIKPEINEDNPGVSVGTKGMKTLLVASKARKIEKLSKFIKECDDIALKIDLHVVCRKRFTDLRKIDTEEKDNTEPPTKKTRSTSKPFVWRTDCFFCGFVCVDKHESVCNVSTLDLRSRILDACDDSAADRDLAEIRFRVQNCIDLVAVDAIYHTECMTRFFLTRKKVSLEEPLDQKRPLGYNSSFIADEERTAGRPERDRL